MPIACALAAVLVSGIDARYYVFWSIQWLFGTGAMMEFSSWFVMCGISLGMFPNPRFGPVALCIALLAIGIHPRSFRWWEFVGLGALALLIPCLPLCALPMSRFLGLPLVGDRWLIGSEGVGTALMIGGIAAVTRNWFATTAAAVVSAFGHGIYAVSHWYYSAVHQYSTSGGGNRSWVLDALDQQSLEHLYKVIAWSWNPALLAVLLWWAIRARRAWKPRWACPSCGYDLRGSAGERCPECGAAECRSEAPAASRRASAGT